MTSRKNIFFILCRMISRSTPNIGHAFNHVYSFIGTYNKLITIKYLVWRLGYIEIINLLRICINITLQTFQHALNFKIGDYRRWYGPYLQHFLRIWCDMKERVNHWKHLNNTISFKVNCHKSYFTNIRIFMKIEKLTFNRIATI